MKLKSYEEYMEKCDDYEVIERGDNDKCEVVRNNGFIIKTWRQNGMKHRLEQDRHEFILPAVIITKLNDKNYLHRIWYENDKENRDKQVIPDFGDPCVYLDDNYGFYGRYSNSLVYKIGYDNIVLILQYKTDDVFCRKGTDKLGRSLPHFENLQLLPCKYLPDIKHHTREWYNDKGKLNREEKDENGKTLPAVIIYSEDTVIEKWMKNGEMKRDDIDEKTGECLSPIEKHNIYEYQSYRRRDVLS